MKEKILNVPNLLSGYRFLVSPVILFLAIRGDERAFAVLICISLVTDVFDGLIARLFHLTTRFGASLDSLGDFATYLLSFYGLVRFRWEAVRPHVWLLLVFVVQLLVVVTISLIRFRRMPGLHLYSCVSAGYLQGAFFFVLFAWGFQPWLYYLAAGWGVLAYVEKTAIVLLIDEIAPGTKGLYWVLKRRRARAGAR
jgi:phosphatidylglycerophosphate synthase